MKIFVLNLDRAKERRSVMVGRLAAAGLEAEFLPAVDGRLIDRATLPAGTETRLLPGEIGCYLSHLRFLQVVVERGLEHAIVLEDDVTISPDLLQVSAEVIAAGMQWDAVRLSALKPVRGIAVAELSHGRRLVLPNKSPSGAQAYLVSLAGARRLLDRLSVPRQAIDTALDAYWKSGLCIPIVTPCPVEEDELQPSTITANDAARLASAEPKTALRHWARVAEAQRRKITVYLMARKTKAARRQRHRT